MSTGWMNETCFTTSWEMNIIMRYLQSTSSKSYHINGGYLARYYTAIDGLTLKAQCLSDHADAIDESFNEFGTTGSYKINEDVQMKALTRLKG